MPKKSEEVKFSVDIFLGFEHLVEKYFKHEEKGKIRQWK